MIRNRSSLVRSSLISGIEGIKEKIIEKEHKSFFGKKKKIILKTSPQIRIFIHPEKFSWKIKFDSDEEMEKVFEILKNDLECKTFIDLYDYGYDEKYNQKNNK